MYMHYVTKIVKEKEILVAVLENELDAHCCGENFDNSNIRSLNQLISNKVIIPEGLKWIVESDKKHQQREVESRTKNLEGLNFS